MAEAASDKRITVQRISAPKPYDLLAEQLRERILRGEIPEGAPLPAERELVIQTGLTRGSVREALRVLAVEGLIQTRPGRYGGNIVTLPGSDSMSETITRFVRGRKLSLRALHETREALEPALARFAALRRTDENLRELKALHERLTACTNDLREFSLTNVRWHCAVARASGNELLSAVLDALSYGVHVSTTTEEYDTPETRQDVIRIHSRIMRAIEDGNADEAERRMREHITATHSRSIAKDRKTIPLSAPSRQPRQKRNAGPSQTANTGADS
ncbi:FadR/GntR family transcriptional regulator [Muricoccus pecuniae]|uniref:DNA-binding FadR family transcriptional regulator n=1 Tax=Muricoccus pecuniae TaxID=693023 RepID=A0A840YI95_9PROT|nr:FadR/GntR family transcriptional regulator [Roseomonas pecuniae]MBB5696227.1 DNA-binding FadR family transcriptional regulator [Roseomonas pecuniae]